jgi:hypothetical protein
MSFPLQFPRSHQSSATSTYDGLSKKEHGKIKAQTYFEFV